MEFNKNIQIFNDNCFNILKDIKDKSIDMILCDLPYGITQNKWDKTLSLNSYVILNNKKYEKQEFFYKMFLSGKSLDYANKYWDDFKQIGLFDEYNRIIKDNGVIVLFGSEPYTSTLINSNKKYFKYNWIWQKNKSTSFFNAKIQPLNDHETISIFYKKQCIYNPQKTLASKVYKRGYVNRKKSECYGTEKNFIQIDDGFRYPKRIIYFNNNFTYKQLHPTQKPVELCEYLIKTYTNENMIVLDNCMGVGTTGMACINTNRKFIGIEINEKYFNISKELLNIKK